MKKWLLTLALTVSSTSHAEGVKPLIDDPAAADELCFNESKNLIKRYEMDGEPTYFVKPLLLGGRTKFGFVHNDKPVIFDPEGDVKYTELRGNYDPVASFDNKIVTVLEGANRDYTMLFYDADSIANNKPQLLDWPAKLRIYGAYQSIAPMKLANGKDGYKIVIDQVHTDQEGAITMFPSFINAERVGDAMVPQGENLEPVCPGKRLQVPFVAKDGKKLAALNLETGTTQVFSIENGTCDMKYDVGYHTAKADFSYDNKKLVFHISDVPDTDRFGWIKRPTDGNVSNVFTLDLESGKLEKITNNVSTSSYYPVFMPDGTIMHIDKITNGKNAKYGIGISKQAAVAKSATDAAAGICNCSVENKKNEAFAIGSLLSALCSDAELQKKVTDEKAIVLKAEGLNSTQCQALVKKFWNEGNVAKIEGNTNWEKIKTIPRKAFTDLKVEDLLAACPTDTKSK